jgi:hypothetical protein
MEDNDFAQAGAELNSEPPDPKRVGTNDRDSLLWEAFAASPQPLPEEDAAILRALARHASRLSFAVFFDDVAFNLEPYEFQ